MKVHLIDKDSVEVQKTINGRLTMLFRAVCGLTFLSPSQNKEITYREDEVTCKRCKKGASL